MQVYILKEEEGGRKKPFTNNFCPVMYTYTADTAVRVQLPEGKEFVLPGMVNKGMFGRERGGVCFGMADRERYIHVHIQRGYISRLVVV